MKWLDYSVTRKKKIPSIFKRKWINISEEEKNNKAAQLENITLIVILFFQVYIDIENEEI